MAALLIAAQARRLAHRALALAVATMACDGCHAATAAAPAARVGPASATVAATTEALWRPVAPAAVPNFHEIPFDAALPPSLTDTVVLTFDDGPDAAGRTARVLDILRDRQVHATFFVNGDTTATAGPIDAAPALGATIRRMFAEGHSVGNHTVHHLELRDLSAAAVAGELDNLEDAVRHVTRNGALRLTLLRAPFGRPLYAASRLKDPATFARVAGAMAPRGVHVAWNIDPHDWDEKEPDAVLAEVLALIDGGRRGVILLHSTQARTVAILPQLIDAIRARGLRIATTEEYVKEMFGAASAALVATDDAMRRP